MFVHDLIMQGKPEAMAIVDHERRFTYKEAQEAVKNCRNRLYEAGVREGDRVGIFSRNSADFVFAYMGATSLGAIAVPINFQLSNREIAYIIKDSGIRVLLTYQPLNLVDALAALRCDLKVTQYDIKTMGKANIDMSIMANKDFLFTSTAKDADGNILKRESVKKGENAISQTTIRSRRGFCLQVERYRI